MVHRSLSLLTNQLPAEDVCAVPHHSSPAKKDNSELCEERVREPGPKQPKQSVEKPPGITGKPGRLTASVQSS